MEVITFKENGVVYEGIILSEIAKKAGLSRSGQNQLRGWYRRVYGNSLHKIPRESAGQYFGPPTRLVISNFDALKDVPPALEPVKKIMSPFFSGEDNNGCYIPPDKEESEMSDIEALMIKLSKVSELDSEIRRQKEEVARQEELLQAGKQRLRELTDSRHAYYREVHAKLGKKEEPQNPWEIRVNIKITAQIMFDALVSYIMNDPGSPIPGSSEDLLKIAQEYASSLDSSRPWWVSTYIEYTEEEQEPPLPHGTTLQSLRDRVRSLIPKAPGEIRIPEEIAYI